MTAFRTGYFLSGAQSLRMAERGLGVNTNVRPAFYALQKGAWRDYVTLLHFPYTAWHLSYVVFGAAAAPSVHLDRVGGLILAFFLAVGLGAHALDEFHGRPLRTSIPSIWLLTIAIISLTGALAIGVLAALTISYWAIPFVIFGVFIILAYNLELGKGRFHSDAWFSLAWGGYPALVGYWANAERLDVQAFLIAIACIILSLTQRTLSNWARGLRRNAKVAIGHIEYEEGRIEALSIPYILAVPERALRLLSLSVTFLAVGWLVARL